jgi:hypothetical protein
VDGKDKKKREIRKRVGEREIRESVDEKDKRKREIRKRARKRESGQNRATSKK